MNRQQSINLTNKEGKTMNRQQLQLLLREVSKRRNHRTVQAGNKLVDPTQGYEQNRKLKPSLEFNAFLKDLQSTSLPFI